MKIYLSTQGILIPGFASEGQRIVVEENGLTWLQPIKNENRFNFYAGQHLYIKQILNCIKLGGIANWRYPTKEELANWPAGLELWSRRYFSSSLHGDLIDLIDGHGEVFCRCGDEMYLHEIGFEQGAACAYVLAVATGLVNPRPKDEIAV